MHRLQGVEESLKISILSCDKATRIQISPPHNTAKTTWMPELELRTQVFMDLIEQLMKAVNIIIYVMQNLTCQFMPRHCRMIRNELYLQELRLR